MPKNDYVCGLHAVRTLLGVRPDCIRVIHLAEQRRDARAGVIAERARAAGIPVETSTHAELEGMQPGIRHQGVIARIVSSRAGLREQDLGRFLADLDGPPLLLVLDGVQDPHNLGACLRTADAAGADAVIVPRDRAAGITPVVRKVASGAAETVPVFSVTNLARALRILRQAGIWLYGASDTAQSLLYEADFTGSVALVLGGEGKGLRRLTRELCDQVVAIPMAGRVESLNVSVAAGVLLFEAARQRR
ncbi:MAG: 23S rRNA (guanosine(2251)-2'-O)-methyltransferase RlmB [Gammaproteobacteria bacterium]|jgi:23S rRNA (guanosine2251-2'-O)-methyltransferase